MKKQQHTTNQNRKPSYAQAMRAVSQDQNLLVICERMNEIYKMLNENSSADTMVKMSLRPEEMIEHLKAHRDDLINQETFQEREIAQLRAKLRDAEEKLAITRVDIEMIRNGIGEIYKIKDDREDKIRNTLADIRKQHSFGYHTR